MSKKETAVNALDDLMGKSPEVATPVTEPKKETATRKKEEYKNFTIRLSNTDRSILEGHFRNKGIISLAIGIRAILADYMKEEGLK